MKDQRETARRRVLKAGIIAFGHAGGIDCLVRNLSDSGACLEIESPVGIPNAFTLVIPQDEIRRSAKVKWRKAKRIGAMFD
jgi:hypothetical protein